MRVILHSDINNCFASIEMAIRPELKNRPIAVCGDPAQRRGIVLAKSEAAKRCGVATGDPLWRAREKCPGIIFVQPHFEVYEGYARSIRSYYLKYTPYVEPFGLDECWLDISSCHMDMVQARAVAERIRQDIRRLFDITVSIGVSFNKVFAKLGSDMKKPDAVTCIAASEFRHQVWGLPVSQLLGVGRATAERLRYLGIVKIGQLATCDRQLLRQTLGKNGDMLWLAANGLENTPVRRFDESEPRQSLGHGTTLPVDIGDVVQIWPVIESLSERVAFELQAESLTGCGLQLMVRDSALQFHLYQHKFSRPLCTSRQIANCSLMLLSQRYMWMRAIRAIGIRIYGLRSVFLPVQRTWMDYVHSLDTHTCDRAADAAVDQVIRAIQGRFGTDCMRRGYQCNGIKSQPGFFPSVYGRGGG